MFYRAFSPLFPTCSQFVHDTKQSQNGRRGHEYDHPRLVYSRIWMLQQQHSEIKYSYTAYASLTVNTLLWFFSRSASWQVIWLFHIWLSPRWQPWGIFPLQFWDTQCSRDKWALGCPKSLSDWNRRMQSTVQSFEVQVIQYYGSIDGNSRRITGICTKWVTSRSKHSSSTSKICPRFVSRFRLPHLNCIQPLSKALKCREISNIRNMVHRHGEKTFWARFGSSAVRRFGYSGPDTFWLDLAWLRLA